MKKGQKGRDANKKPRIGRQKPAWLQSSPQRRNTLGPAKKYPEYCMFRNLLGGKKQKTIMWQGRIEIRISFRNKMFYCKKSR